MCVCSVETVQVGFELDEGRRLGSLKISGCPAGEEGRRTRQRGNTLPQNALLK